MNIFLKQASLGQPDETLEAWGADERKLVRTHTQQSELVKNEGIAIVRVSFYHPAHGKEFVSKSDFSIPFGKSVALVGTAGCGKTSMLKLISRVYQPTSGFIFVDSFHLNDIETETVLSVVDDQNLLYNMTLRDNIILGNENVTDDEFHRAVSIAQLGDEVSKLPNEWDTMAGIRGKGVTRSLAQRISIARAILRPKRYINMDEPTSNQNPTTHAI